MRAGRRGRARLVAALLFAVGTCGIASCRDTPAQRAPLLVFAASDLRDALRDIAQQFRRRGGDSAVLVFGSTGMLAVQIANGAPADLFFAADAAAIDSLAAHAQLVDSTRRVYALGRLALIARGGRRIGLDELTTSAVRTIAIADPAHAPYGRAAKEALEGAGIWSVVESKIVRGSNVSQAEQFVSTGNADAGLVALSLVLRTPARAYMLVDSTLHRPLLQTAAVVRRSTNVPGASALLAFVTSDSGRAVMARYGFRAP